MLHQGSRLRQRFQPLQKHIKTGRFVRFRH